MSDLELSAASTNHNMMMIPLSEISLGNTESA